MSADSALRREDPAFAPRVVGDVRAGDGHDSPADRTIPPSQWRAVAPLVDALLTLVVSVYLAFALAYLVLTNRLDPGVSLLALLRGALRGPAAGSLDGLAPEQGHCFVARVPSDLISDAEGRSRLQVFEDGHPLGPGHAMHADVRSLGRGRFSHWGGMVYLSASDNSDPRANGRTYTFSTHSDRA